MEILIGIMLGILSTIFYKIGELIGKIKPINNNLKCCGNCKKYQKEICPYSEITEDRQYFRRSDFYCNSWVFDGMTQKERMEDK